MPTTYRSVKLPSSSFFSYFSSSFFFPILDLAMHSWLVSSTQMVQVYSDVIRLLVPKKGEPSTFSELCLY